MLTDTLCTLDTGYYADTVEWCPAKGFEDYLVCGTYQLLENKEKNDGSALCPEEYSSIGNKRVGNVQLYRLNESRTRSPVMFIFLIMKVSIYLFCKPINKYINFTLFHYVGWKNCKLRKQVVF